VRLLDTLGLPGPARLPVRLWRACMLDRCVRVYDIHSIDYVYFNYCRTWWASWCAA
jgi:hypothetical protein